MIAASSRLLEQVDKLGLLVHTAAWIYHEDAEEWRFYLFTDLVKWLSHIRIYKLLLQAFRVIGFPEGMDRMDIYVAPRNHHLNVPLEMVYLLGTGVYRMTDTVINGVKYDAVALRVNSPPTLVPFGASTRATRRAALNFERQVEQLVAA